MGVVIEDNSDAFLKQLENAIGDPGGGLDAATQFGASKTRESMPGAGAAAIHGTGGKKGTIVAYIPSNPGQPPGVRSQGGNSERLRDSQTNARVGPMRWAWGSNVSYARALEFGTADMPARPFLRPALRNNRDAIGRVFIARVRRIMGGAQ